MFQDEKLARLSPTDRLVWVGLISMADDAGRLPDLIKQIDGFIFPYTDDTALESIETLIRIKRLLRYELPSGRELLQIVNWRRHQRVVNPSPHVLPPPSTDDLQDAGISQLDDSEVEVTASSIESIETLNRPSLLDVGSRIKDVGASSLPVGTARARFLAVLPNSSARLAWSARLDGWLAGMDGVRATEPDIEKALGDWELNGTGAVNAQFIRRHVEKSIADRTQLRGASSARRAPKLSPGKQAYINAGLALDAIGVPDTEHTGGTQ